MHDVFMRIPWGILDSQRLITLRFYNMVTTGKLLTYYSSTKLLTTVALL